MTSTRVIRPKSFKVNTTYARNTRSVSLPTPAKFRADTGVFQDIGAKLVRPQSRKEKSWTARSKGLRTSAGLQAQLLKEQGIKIQIGDKTLKELLEVEVPDMSREEYIKNDGSVGVRMTPVLDAQGNPVMVKKKLSIPGSIAHAQKPLKKKLEDIEAVLGDIKMPEEQKQDASVLLLTGIMQNTDLTNNMLNQIDTVTNKMGALNMVNEIPAADLIDGRFIDSSFITRNRAFVKSLAFMQARGLGYTAEYPLRSVDLGPEFLQSINVLDNLRTLGNPDDLLFDVKTNTFISRDIIDRYVGERAEEIKAAPTPDIIPIIPFDRLIMNRYVSSDYAQRNLVSLKQLAASRAGFLGRNVSGAIRILIPELNTDQYVSLNALDNMGKMLEGKVYFDTATNTIISKANANSYNNRTGKLRTELQPKTDVIGQMLAILPINIKNRLDFTAFNLSTPSAQLQAAQAAATAAGQPVLGMPVIPAAAPPLLAPPPSLPGLQQAQLQQAQLQAQQQAAAQIPLPPSPPSGLIPIMQPPPLIQEQKFQAPGVPIQPPLDIAGIRQRMEQLRPPPEPQLPIARPGFPEEEKKVAPPRVAAPVAPPPQFVPDAHFIGVSETEEKAFDSLKQKGVKLDTGIKIQPNQVPMLNDSLGSVMEGTPPDISRNLEMRLGGQQFRLSTLTPDEAALLKRMVFLGYITVSAGAVVPAPIVARVMDDQALIAQGVNAQGLAKLRQLGVAPSVIIGLSWKAGQAVSKTLDGDTPEQDEADALETELKVDPATISDDNEALQAFNHIFTIGREQGGRGKKNRIYNISDKGYYNISGKGRNANKHLRMGKNLISGFGYICPRNSLASEIFSFG